MSDFETDWEDEDVFVARPYGAKPYGAKPYGAKPYGAKPYGAKPYGAKPYGAKPYGAKRFGARPYGAKPYGAKPYGAKPYGAKPFEEEGGFLDPEEWSADVAELVCDRSAIIRLGATLVAADELPVGAFDAPGAVRAPGLAGPPPAVGALGVPPVLRPADWKLEAGVLVIPELRRALEADPRVAEPIKVDLAEALARGADQVLLQGAGPPGGPAGIGALVGPAPGAVAGDLLATARQVVQAVRQPAAGQPPTFRNPGWILSQDTLELLTRLPTADCLTVGGAGARALDSYRTLQLDGVDGGVFLGYAFVVSEGAAAAGQNNLYFAADWQEALIGIDPSFVTVHVSTEPPPVPPGQGFVIRASISLDFALRRPNAFSWA